MTIVAKEVVSPLSDYMISYHITSHNIVFKTAYFQEIEFFHEYFKIIVYGILYVKFKLNFSMTLKSKKSL